jgi:AcrR family transcriptional regulator
VPRRIDLDRRRAQLAEAVWATIRQRGIGAVSVRTVAAEAGVAVGSLRHVFPTRSELLQFSAELMAGRATERIIATELTGDPEADALALLRHLLPLEADSRAELDVNLALIAEAPALPELVPIRDRTHAQIHTMCERVIRLLAPTLDPRVVAREAARLFALIDGLALHLLGQAAGRGDEWAVEILGDEIRRIRRMGSEVADSTTTSQRRP